MHSQIIRHARNGALGAIALYLLVTLPLLGISMGHKTELLTHASPSPAVNTVGNI